MPINPLYSQFTAEFLKHGDTDERKGIPMPPAEKSVPENSTLIDLIDPAQFNDLKINLVDAIKQRKSRRKFINQPIILKELSLLLWATQGHRNPDAYKEFKQVQFRNVPSGGCRHPFESYILVNKVIGLTKGLYRYVASRHQLLLLKEDVNLMESLIPVVNEQKFIKDAGVVFIWTAIPYRTEWRYGANASKLIAIDAGHVCQNLYLAVEAINCGTCAIGAYIQDQIDQWLGVDGKEEFVIYMAPVGKINQ